MKPLCEIIVQQVLPPVRAIITKELVEEYGMKGKDVAKALHITPAAITHYLKKARGSQTKVIMQNKKVSGEIKALSKKIAEGKMAPTDEMKSFCDICRSIRKEGIICAFHLKTSDMKTCDICLKEDICK